MELTRIHDFKTLARAISIVENEAPDFESLLSYLQPYDIPVIGFTGPPGAGKSTLLNAALGVLLNKGKRIGLILVDPSSPFNMGALLGDRLRMTSHFNNPLLFIRSVASRGSLGGLSDKIIEIVEVMRAYPFDYIFIETVGVGQSEVEIAGLADITVVVLVPEAGDSVQMMKAGLMEIANVFVINKADRADAEALENALVHQLQMSGRENIPVLKTVAVESKGVHELLEEINRQYRLSLQNSHNGRRQSLLTEKALRLIARHRMKNFPREQLENDIKTALTQSGFNLYRFIQPYL